MHTQSFLPGEFHTNPGRHGYLHMPAHVTASQYTADWCHWKHCSRVGSDPEHLCNLVMLLNPAVSATQINCNYSIFFPFKFQSYAKSLML